MDPRRAVKSRISPRTALVLDWLIVVSLLLMLVLRWTGGFYAEPWGVRISIRKLERPFVLSLILILLRRWLGPDHGFLGKPAARYRAWWNAYFRRDADAVSPQTSSRLQSAFSVIALVAVGLAPLYQQLLHMDSVPDLGDPLFSIWRMGWVAHQFSGDPRGLFDGNIFYPTPLTLTLSDSMLLPSLTAVPLLKAGVAPAVAYNVLLLSGFVTSGVTAYFLIKRVTRSVPAAFIGGLMYMLYPYRAEHYSHLELQMTQWMPLSLLLLLRFRDSLRLRDALLAALCAVATLYSSMYYGVFFPFYAAAVLGVLFVISRPSWRRVLTPAVVAGVVALALAVPLAIPYVRAEPMKGERGEGAVRFYSADLSDFLRPHPRLATHAGRWLKEGRPERALFPGITPVVLSAVALAPPIGELRLAFTAGLLLATDMTQGMKGTLYPFLYKWFPPIRGMRVAARFSVILGISLVVLAGFGVRRLLARFRSPRLRGLMFVGMVGLVLIDLHPKLDLIPVWPGAPAVYKALEKRTDPIVLAEFPFETQRPLVANELPYMYFSIWHWRPMVNGYSGFIPEAHAALVEVVRGFPDPASIVALRMHGVTHVTINCYLWVGNCAGAVMTADHTPQLVRIKSGVWEGQVVRLYEIAK
jgi:hypothetical protein